MRNKKLYVMALYAMFVAVIMILGLTPFGFITLPWAAITTLHIPVIIGACLFGVKGGALLGFFFGLVSFIRCFTTPDAIATIVLGAESGGFAGKNFLMVVLIIFVPRILVGVVTALLYRFLSRLDKSSTWSVSVSAFAGSLTNSVLVLGFLALLAFSQVEAVLGVMGAWTVIGTLVSLNVVNILLEALAAILICTPVTKALRPLAVKKLGVGK